MRTRKRLFWTSILAVGLLAGGCSDSITRGGTDDVRPTPKGPSQDPENGDLRHVEPCTPTQPRCQLPVATDSEHPLRAKVVDASGEAIEDIEVTFSIEQGSNVVTRSTEAAYTDETGVAEITLASAPRRGTASIEASVSEPGIDPIRWIVGVAPDGGGNYRIEVVHKGKSKIEDLKVSLFPAPPDVPGGAPDGETCETLRSESLARRDPDLNGSIPTAAVQKTGTIGPGGKTGEILIPRAGGQAFTVWVRGFKASNNSQEPPVEYAWGCATGDKITAGETVRVEVPLKDHLPLMQNEYRITHTFNLLGVLPPNIRRVVNLVGMFTKSPGAFVVGCDQNQTTGRNGKKLCPQDDMPGLLDLLEKRLPSNIASAVDTLQSSGVWGPTLRDIIDRVAFNVIGQNKLAGESIDIAQDVYDNLRDFRVRGPMEFDRVQFSDPSYSQGGATVQQTIPETAAVQKWTEFGFYWKDGCKNAQNPPACRTKWFRSNKIIQNQNPGRSSVAKGKFTAMRGGVDDISIEPHALEVNFGGLLIGMLERVILPRYFSDGNNRETVASLDDNCPDDRDRTCPDGVVSFEELFRAVIDCNEVAREVDQRVGLGMTVKKVCRSLQSQVVDRLKQYIRDQLAVRSDGIVELETGRVLQEGESFRGQTCSPPSGESQCEIDAPCRLHQPASYPANWPESPLPVVEAFGDGSSQTDKCNWIVDVQFGSQYGGTVPGWFYGSVK